MPSHHDIIPMVSKLHWTKGNHEDEDVYYYYDEEGNYYDPYYNYSNAFGEWLATVDWELVFVWGVILAVYLGLSMIGPWLFPPMLICLLSTEGDLETCSLGIWSNGYKEPETKCHDR